MYGYVSAIIANWIYVGICEGLTAHKYIDEIITPHVKLHNDNNALADRSVFMRVKAKPHTARIRQDVLINATGLLWTARIQILISSLMVYHVQTHKGYESITPKSLRTNDASFTS